MAGSSDDWGGLRQGAGSGGPLQVRSYEMGRETLRVAELVRLQIVLFEEPVEAFPLDARILGRLSDVALVTFQHRREVGLAEIMSGALGRFVIGQMD